MIPRWLIWMFLVVFGTMLYQVNGGHSPAPATSPASNSPAAQPSYPQLAKVTDAEHWKEALSPDYAVLKKACTSAVVEQDRLSIVWTQTVEGAGAGAACGDAIGVHVRRADGQGRLGPLKPLNITIGKSGVPGFDAALVGLTPGGQRVVVIPATKVASSSPLHGIVSPTQTTVLTISR